MMPMRGGQWAVAAVPAQWCCHVDRERLVLSLDVSAGVKPSFQSVMRSHRCVQRLSAGGGPPERWGASLSVVFPRAYEITLGLTFLIISLTAAVIDPSHAPIITQVRKDRRSLTAAGLQSASPVPSLIDPQSACSYCATCSQQLEPQPQPQSVAWRAPDHGGLVIQLPNSILQLSQLSSSILQLSQLPSSILQLSQLPSSILQFLQRWSREQASALMALVVLPDSPPRVVMPPIPREKIAAHDKIERERARRGCCARCCGLLEMGEHTPYHMTCGEEDSGLPGAIVCAVLLMIMLMLFLLWVLVTYLYKRKK